MRMDGHIHLGEGPADSNRLLADMAMAGFDGGVLISPPPACWRDRQFVRHSIEKRLARLQTWTTGQPSLFPVYWIDPTDSDALEQVATAVEAGVAGFKVICSTHAPGDARAMPVYRAIAAQNKPILFHSGILWDGMASSELNRPAAFEALLEVPRLRFALAHISWPWVDECLAVFGKFRHAASVRPDAPEMFIDTTPGTPEIYRAEALTKLFTIGYNLSDHAIFGTDGSAPGYEAEWTRTWADRDLAILRRLGLGEDVQARYFGGNLQRWLTGLEQKSNSVAAVCIGTW